MTEVQCPREGCEGTRAAFYSVQIRSADEPMTNFFKVCWCLGWWLGVLLMKDSVRRVLKSGGIEIL